MNVDARKSPINRILQARNFERISDYLRQRHDFLEINLHYRSYELCPGDSICTIGGDALSVRFHMACSQNWETERGAKKGFFNRVIEYFIEYHVNYGFIGPTPANKPCRNLARPPLHSHLLLVSLSRSLCD